MSNAERKPSLPFRGLALLVCRWMTRAMQDNSRPAILESWNRTNLERTHENIAELHNYPNYILAPRGSPTRFYILALLATLLSTLVRQQITGRAYLFWVNKARRRNIHRPISLTLLTSPMTYLVVTQPHAPKAVDSIPYFE